MMGEDADWLRTLAFTLASGAQLLQEQLQRLVLADEAPIAAPCDQVHVGVDLGKAAGAPAAIAAEALQPRLLQARDQAFADPVPGWGQHWQEAPARQAGEALARLREPLERRIIAFRGRELGLFLARPGAVAMVAAVHEHARRVLQRRGLAGERNRGKGDRHAGGLRK